MFWSTFVVFAFCLVPTAVYGTALGDFFQEIHEQPVVTYQCFRNATSFEDPSATDLSIIWDGQNLPQNEAHCDTVYSMPGSEAKTRFPGTAEYIPENDYAVVTGAGIRVELYILPPYNEKAYYFKEVVTPSGKISMKIYDTSPTCENAQALRKQVCPESCDLEPTR